MLTLYNDRQLSFAEASLPKELLGLSEELAKVDALLDDPHFMEPFLKRFDTRIGRPTVPVETYLRLMYLKHRYNLGYETLVKEVSDSIMWRRFCRIPLTQKVPHATTLIKLTQRYGPKAVEELNRALLAKARAKKLIRGKKLRVDTTVVAADIHHPTDAGLLADGIRVITRCVQKIKNAGVSLKGGFTNRTRTIKKKILSIAKVLKRRSQEAKSEVREITRQILKVAEEVVARAKEVAEQAKEEAAKAGTKGVLGLVASLKRVVELTDRVINQTKEVEAGNLHLPQRVVSLFDPEARPIKRGKLKEPCEFGYKVLLAEAEKGIITDYQVLTENLPDNALLEGVVLRHRENFDRPPQALTADRGFSDKTKEEELRRQGVAKIAIPCRGKRSKSREEYEEQPWFKRLYRWRAGCEATISLLKRKYGLRRSRLRGHRGASIWAGWGVLAHNVVRIGANV
ncbi:MAG: ISNCY family transposase [Desulfitobacteriaceae bacterium]|nr:ISNCY family transposase [Desulfitobacteriaceae bacterium]